MSFKRSFKGRYGGGYARGRGVGYKKSAYQASRRRARLMTARSATYRRRRSRNIRTGGFLGIETKFYDTSLVDGALTAPTDAAGGEHDESATICATTITEGDGEQQRDGRKAVVKSCFVNGVIEQPFIQNSATMVAAGVAYVALVLDKQSNGATIVSEQVFKNDGANAVLAASPMRNMQFTSRYQILDRVQVVMPQQQPTWDGTNIEQTGSTQPFKLSWRGELPINYTNTTETIANTVDNSIHVIAYISDASNSPTISYNCRVRFQG